MNTTNKHAILVNFKGWNEKNGASCTVTSKRFKQSIKFNNLTEAQNVNGYIYDVINRLAKRGFNILDKCEFGQDSYILISDTFEPLKLETFKFKFEGRKINAIGKFYNYSKTIKAISKEIAEIELYKEFDHIHKLTQTN